MMSMTTLKQWLLRRWRGSYARPLLGVMVFTMTMCLTASQTFADKRDTTSIPGINPPAVMTLEADKDLNEWAEPCWVLHRSEVYGTCFEWVPESKVPVDLKDAYLAHRVEQIMQEMQKHMPDDSFGPLMHHPQELPNRCRKP
jgi:hypothetical protein